MSLEITLRLIEIGVSLALLQRAAEHLPSKDQILFGAQMVLAILLIVGLFRGPLIGALWMLGVAQLHRFDGPYNGGADKMALLALTCLGVAHLFPNWADVALAYLAVQLIFSYVISGGVKLLNAEWRSGRALCGVFAHSVYPVSENLRGLAGRRKILFAASWAVILFEVAFPIALLHPGVLVATLAVAAAFHLANACLFGLNRFLWIWISVYPALFWLQDRLISA